VEVLHTDWEIGDERKKATNDGRSLSLDNSEEKEGRYRVMNTFRRSRVYAGESDIRNLEVKSLAAKGIFRSGPEMTVSSPGFARNMKGNSISAVSS